jgi:hypothetical protein
MMLHPDGMLHQQLEVQGNIYDVPARPPGLDHVLCDGVPRTATPVNPLVGCALIARACVKAVAVAVSVPVTAEFRHNDALHLRHARQIFQHRPVFQMYLSDIQIEFYSKLLDDQRYDVLNRACVGPSAKDRPRPPFQAPKLTDHGYVSVESI